MRVKDYIIDQQNQFDDTDYGYRETLEEMRRYAEIDHLHYMEEEVSIEE